MERSTSDRAWDIGKGAVGGAALLAAIGFFWGGWVTDGTHTKALKSASASAVVTALAPICVDAFGKSADAVEQKTAMMKVSTWSRGDFIAKGGWATLPGSKAPNSAVATACAEMLSK